MIDSHLFRHALLPTGRLLIIVLMFAPVFTCFARAEYRITPGDTVEVVYDLMRTVVEWQPVTITTQQWSLLYATATEPVELYDLRIDPKQTTNVAAKHPTHSSLKRVRSIPATAYAGARRSGKTGGYSRGPTTGLAGS